MSVILLSIALVTTSPANEVEEPSPTPSSVWTKPNRSSGGSAEPAPAPAPTVDELAIAREQCNERNTERDINRSNATISLQDAKTQLAIVQSQYEEADAAYWDAAQWGTPTDEAVASSRRSTLNLDRIMWQGRVNSHLQALATIDSSYENCNF